MGNFCTVGIPFSLSLKYRLSFGRVTDTSSGNLYSERKVVLDEEMVNHESKFEDVIVVAPGDIRRTFLDAVTKECNEARKLEHPVVVLIFTHGDKSNFGVYLGGDSNQTIIPQICDESMCRNAKGILGSHWQGCSSNSSVNSMLFRRVDNTTRHPEHHRRHCIWKHETFAVLASIQKC
jgi:hypothetical protein